MRYRMLARIGTVLALMQLVLAVEANASEVVQQGRLTPHLVGPALDSAARLLADGKAEQALIALEPIDQYEPENPWLWFYRGAAYQQLSRPYDALRCYDEARDILNRLGDPEAELAEALSEARRHTRQQLFGLSWRVGLAYDTNVSYLGDSTVDLIDVVSGEEDCRFASQFRLEYAPVADHRQTLSAGIRLEDSWHSSVESFDYQDYGITWRYARRLTQQIEMSLRYDYDVAVLDRDGFLSDHSLTPTVSYYWSPEESSINPVKTSLYYNFEARDFLFETEPEFDRDGLAHAVGIDHLTQLTLIPDWTWELTTGYRFTAIETEGREYDRPTHDFLIGLAFPLINPVDPDEFLIMPDKPLLFRFTSQWHLANYDNASLIDSDGDARSDLITAYSWSVAQQIMSHPRFGELTLHGLVHWTDAESNITIDSTSPARSAWSPFTYDKIVYGLQIEWSW